MSRTETNRKKNKADNSKQSNSSSRKGSAGWVLAIFFISVWMFVLGVLVGRGTSPLKFDIEKFEKEISALRASAEKKELEQQDLEKYAEKGRGRLEFYEELKKTGAEDDDDLIEPVIKRAAIKAPEEPKTKKPAPKIKKPELVRKKEKKRAEKPAPGKYTIQVASLKEKRQADGLARKLRKKGLPVYIEEAAIRNKGVWYRVRIGSYKSKDEAKKFIRDNRIEGFILKL